MYEIFQCGIAVSDFQYCVKFGFDPEIFCDKTFSIGFFLDWQMNEISFLYFLMQNDDTYETQSRISFVASRFENGEFITCEANNPVLEFYTEEPQRASITLQVSCK